MAIEFNRVRLAPLRQFSGFAPDGAVVGVIGASDSGSGTLLRLAAGLDNPESGTVTAAEPRRWIGSPACPGFPLARTLALAHTFSQFDALERAKGILRLEELRRGGATILLASHDESLLLETSDELWWLRQGELAMHGNPGEVLEQYRRYVAATLRAWGQRERAPLGPAWRRGDGRARVLQIVTYGSEGRPTMVWASGEPAGVRVTVRFERDVQDPVVGIMIRNRIGVEVYGTNTALQKLKLGPRRAGDTIRVSFAFNCDLCPQEYTLTVASHDPDGLWHDWLEDAAAFLVTGDRHEAGVANLRARAAFELVTKDE
jgi:lipopolysaccharide transport system ATP-binding protein